MTNTKKIKCPRCKLPQKETVRCQYCGYALPKNTLPTKTILNQFKNIIGVLNKKQTYATKNPKLTDYDGTRSGSDRRKYTMMNYFPERRSGKDRRIKFNRRGQSARKRF